MISMTEMSGQEDNKEAGAKADLLTSGADILCKGPDGDSALQLASEEGRDEVVKTLLDQGLDVNTRGDYDRTPLMNVALYGHESTVNMLIDNALHNAAMRGEDTIDRGMDIDIDRDGVEMEVADPGYQDGDEMEVADAEVVSCCILLWRNIRTGLAVLFIIIICILFFLLACYVGEEDSEINFIWEEIY